MAITLDKITLTETTLTNPKAVEYQWVRTLYVQGYQPEAINHYIQALLWGRCYFLPIFFRRVAMHEESLYLLLQYLNCAPSSREF
ncbi:hypothetical protein AAY53_11555 [Vibrio metoecus]|nr:hypothetical protein AAY53_11555 [Vibrio metoecus]